MISQSGASKPCLFFPDACVTLINLSAGQFKFVSLNPQLARYVVLTRELEL